MQSPVKKDPTDKQGILSEAEEGKLDNDRHMYTIKKKPKITKPKQNKKMSQ